MKINTTGLHCVRLNDPINSTELLAAITWKLMNKDNNPIIDYIIPNSTERDQEVAATVIQWLGTNVGREFVSKVIKNEK